MLLKCYSPSERLLFSKERQPSLEEIDRDWTESFGAVGCTFPRFRFMGFRDSDASLLSLSLSLPSCSYTVHKIKIQSSYPKSVKHMTPKYL